MFIIKPEFVGIAWRFHIGDMPAGNPLFFKSLGHSLMALIWPGIGTGMAPVAVRRISYDDIMVIAR